jgi:triphosphatase
MALEPELKFRIPRSELKSLAAMRFAGTRGGQSAERHLVSTYFDTPKQKLHAHKFTLRVRETNDQFVQTIKSAEAGSFARGEWERKLAKASPDLDHLDETPLGSLIGRKARRKLRPVFQTSVQRITRTYRHGSSEVELAIDRGRVSARRGSENIAEFELELKKGHLSALFSLARSFAERAGAELDLRAKSERGYRLANDDGSIAVHAASIELMGEMTVRRAFDVIAYATLRHFAGNVDGVRAGDAESVHQMRVGLRRIRAAISVFADILPGPSTARMKDELKWLTNELAPAREMDVFLKEQIAPLRRKAEPQRGVRAIEKHFARRRSEALQKARLALDTPRYRRMLIEILEWLEIRGVTDNGGEKKPIGGFVARVIRRRVHKVKKQGRELDKLAPHARHRLRIKIKKLRYAVEFFESLYPSSAQAELKRLSNRLKKIQDALGALNDFVAHRELALDAALHAPRRNRRARAFASGQLVGREQEISRTLVKEASKEFRQLRPPSVKPA